MDERARHDDPRPVPPVPPTDADCCHGGCDRCALERPLRLHHAYSVVYDASTGREVDSCGGCEWLKESRPETAAEHLVARAPSWLQSGLIRFLLRS